MKQRDALIAAGLLAFLALAANRATDGSHTEVATTAERAAVLGAVSALGWPEREVDYVIRVESGWRPGARNPISDASGLIQFMPSTLKALGFAPDAQSGSERAARFRELTVEQQLPWVVQYFRNAQRAWRTPGDTYLVVFAPAFIGAPDNTVIFAEGSKGWQQNPGLRTAGDGPITAGSVRAVIKSRL